MHPCLVCEQRLESQCQRCLSSSLSASIQRRLGGQATSKYDKPHTNADMGMRVRTFHMLAVVQSLVSKAHKAGRKGMREGRRGGNEGGNEGRKGGRRGDKQKGCLCGRVEFVVGFFFVLLFFPFFFVLCSIGKVLSQRKSLAAVNRHTQQNSKHSSCLPPFPFPFPFSSLGLLLSATMPASTSTAPEPHVVIDTYVEDEDSSLDVNEVRTFFFVCICVCVCGMRLRVR